MIRRRWRALTHPVGPRRQHVYDYVVAYFVPGPVWRAWARWFWK